MADAVAAESAADAAALDEGADTLLAAISVSASAVASALEFFPPSISSGNEKAKAFLTGLLATFLLRCFEFCPGGDAAATRLPELAPFNDDDGSFEDSATAEARLGTAAIGDFGAFCEAGATGRPRERGDTAEAGAAGIARRNTASTYERVLIAGR